MSSEQVMAAAPPVAQHKPQQSADSGTFLEWSAEDPGLQERSYHSNVSGEFVTVVAVEQTQEASPFVTVLAIGEKKDKEDDAEEVLVYRLPGERLGFGLKFEGGLKTTERVNRLYIQSCAPDSPASRTRCSCGPLVPGDEILEIDGVHVKDMTRIDCVRSLKESNVVIKLKVKQHRGLDKEEVLSSPPPIPPRKVPRRNSSQREPAIVNPPDGFADESNREIKFKTASPKVSVKNSQDAKQSVPEAEVYLDLIAQEAEVLPGESESDDTGSSISTVVDRLSSAPTTSNSSFSDVRSITSLDITTPPTPTTTNTCPTFDLDRVLEPFLQLEREFSSSATIDESSLFNKLVAAANFTEPSHISVTRTSSMNSGRGREDPLALQPPVSFQDEPGNRGNFDGERVDSAEMFEPISNEKIPIKASPRKSHNIVLNLSAEEKPVPTRSRSNSENHEDEEVDAPALPPKPTPRKELSQKNKFKSGKKRPPPPPPPRSDRPLCPDPDPQETSEDAAGIEDEEDDTESKSELDHHLPRLIDFVPKDRTDVVVPSAIHPENSQQNHMELLIQRQRLLEMIVPQSEEAESDVSGSECEEEHCVPLPMCVPVAESDDEDTETVQQCRSANLTTIGELEEDQPEDEPKITITPSAEEETCESAVSEDLEDPEAATNADKTEAKGAADAEAAVTTSETTQSASVTAGETTDSVECGAMDASVVASLNLSPPPSFSRLPPDGHEFPPNYQESMPEPVISSEMTLKMQPPPPLPATAPPIHKKKISLPSLDREVETHPPVRKYSSCSSASSNGTEDNKSNRSSTWRNDEKSVRSVRDKIAMFSNVTDETPISPTIAPPALNPHKKLNRFKSSEDVFYSNDTVDASSGNLPTGKLFSRSVISVDKIVPNSYLPEVSRSTNPMKKITTYSSMVDMSAVSCPTRQVKPTNPKNLEYTSRTQSSMDLSSAALGYSSESSDSSLIPTNILPTPYMGYSSTLPRKTSTRDTDRKNLVTTPPATSVDNKVSVDRATSFNNANKLHSRSQSLVDVNSLPLNRYVPKTNNSEEARRASLNALIEQRRRSISKLRGLVIPEKVSEDVVPQTIPDLPEIKSKDSILSKVPEEPMKKTLYSSYNSSRFGNGVSNQTTPNYNSTINQTSNLSSLAWKTQPPVVDIPKYSPAFKRKSLAVYGAPSLASSVSSSLSSSREELRPIFDNTTTNGTKSSPPPPSKPPRTISGSSRNSFTSPTATNLSPTLSHQEPPKSLESITSPTQSELSFEFASSNGSSPELKISRNNRYEDKLSQKNGNYIKVNEPQVMPLIKLNKLQNQCDMRRSGGEESDNDSAVSSSRSSISHDFSPPQSPIPDLHNRLGDEDHSSRSHLLLSPSNSAGSSDRRTLRRTLSSETTASAASSTASTLTSGSQASCSSSSTDSLNRRVLKAQSVEAINRKNVLSSARFSSGQDLKIGSPLIQRKFEEGDGFVSDRILPEDFTDETKTEIETENFLEKLNGTLKKEKVTEVLNEENDFSGITHYQLTSPKKEFRTTKVAYLEVEVSDGGNFSSQDDSSFADSNPSSMEHLDSDPVPAPREKLSVKENGYSAQDIITVDNIDGKLDNFTKRNSVIYNPTDKSDLYNENILDNSPTKKTFVKRLSRESCNNNGSSASDDDSLKTTESSRKVENVNITKLNSAPFTVPKPSERKGTMLTSLSNNNSKDSTSSSDDFMSCTSKQDTPTLSPKESPASSSTGKIPTISSRNVNSRRSVSVNDIRKAFEKAEIALSGKPKTGLLNGNGHLIPSHARVSSLDSTTSEDSCAPTPTHYGSITNLQKEQQFGSITSLASSTSLISQQELQLLIEEANQTLEEGGGCSHEVVVVILHRDTAGGSVGITLAGGSDYEAKEITVHKVLAGSPADRDGRIQKGDRILSINGRSMKGVSHRESLTILKAPRPEVVLVVSRWRPDGFTDPQPVEDPLVLSLRNPLRPPRIPESEAMVDTNASDKEEGGESGLGVAWGPPVTVTLVKDGAGLGFSLEGGKDSPLGDQPLTIKKIFTGGCAEKSGQLFAGDELLSVNGTDVTNMTRIDAWGLMKRLADGKVVLTLRHKATN